MITKFNKLRPDQKAWLHAKVALLLWGTLFLFFTPTKIETALGFLAFLVALSIIIGTVTSIIGLYISISQNVDTARRGVNIELAGLYVLLSGPLAYTLTSAFLIFGPEGDQRLPVTALAYAICAFIWIRITLVRIHRKRMNP